MLLSQNMSFNFILNQLKRNGLRITETRKKLVEVLFTREKHQHIIAEVLHHSLLQSDIKISLATVYNTLNVLSDLGLLRKIKTCDYIIFDTDLASHGHMVNENTGEIKDINLQKIHSFIKELSSNNNNIFSKNINVIITYK